jgi:hypothetical protein
VKTLQRIGFELELKRDMWDERFAALLASSPKCRGTLLPYCDVAIAIAILQYCNTCN